MKKKSGKTLMQKWKNKIGGKLSALDKKKLVLTNIPYALAAFYADRAFFLYRNSPGEDMGNKLLYAMEHADRIFAGFVLSNNWKDLLAGIVVAVVLKVLVWQKQADAKKLRKGIEYGSARWGTAEDIKPYMSEDPWMNIPLTANGDEIRVLNKKETMLAFRTMFTGQRQTSKFRTFWITVCTACLMGCARKLRLRLRRRLTRKSMSWMNLLPIWILHLLIALRTLSAI